MPRRKAYCAAIRGASLKKAATAMFNVIAKDGNVDISKTKVSVPRAAAAYGT